MKHIRTILNMLWHGWSILCGLLGLLLVIIFWCSEIFSSPDDRQIRSHETKIIPLASYIESYRATNGRLPTEYEFKEWARGENLYCAEYYAYRSCYPSVTNNYFSGSRDTNRDYVVGVWDGDATHYYRSWDSKVYVDP